MRCALLLGGPTRGKMRMSSMASLSALAMPAMGFIAPRRCLPLSSASRYISSMPFAPASSLPLVSTSPLQHQPQRWWSDSRLFSDITNDEDAAAAAPPAIPLDIDNYKDLFSDASFWDPELEDAAVMELLDERVLGQGQSAGELWKPLIDVRTDIVAAVKEDDEFTFYGLETDARSWDKATDAAKPILQWIATRYKGGKDQAQDVVDKIHDWLDDAEQTLDDFIQRRLTRLSHREVERLSHGAGKTFYVGTVNFRHQGWSLRRPRKVVLDASNSQKKGNALLVYSSESGSGKTVELAGSAFLRGCAISMVGSVSKEDNLPKTLTEEERRAQCIETLKKRFDALAEYNKEAFETILQAINDWVEPNDNPTADVRIVFCIDETSSCLNLVQTIINEKDLLYKTMGDYIASGFGGVLDEKFKTDRPIRVVFSIASTGAYGGTVGAQIGNYKCLKPSGNTVTKELYDTLKSEYDTSGDGYENIATFEDLKTRPFLGIIAQGNARMASILIDQMFHSGLLYNNPNDEIRLMYSVFERFINSNGMCSLWSGHEGWNKNAPPGVPLAEIPNSQHLRNHDIIAAKDRMAASSQAFAVLLYPEPFELPANDTTAQAKAMTLSYGPSFHSFYSAFRGTAPVAPAEDDWRTPMRLLVRKYGLVVQAEFTGKWTETQTLSQPFIMKDVMRLLCIWLASSGKRSREADALLGAHSFGFEVLSTQLVSCAITAAMTIEEKKRKNVHHILTKSLKMFLGGYTNDSDDTAEHVDKEIKEAWEAFKDVIPVSTECDLTLDGMYSQKSAMWLNKRDEHGNTETMGDLDKVKGIMVTPSDGDVPCDLSSVEKRDLDLAKAEAANVETLFMDKHQMEGLQQLADNKGKPPHTLFPALATVAGSDSNLADGSVSFIGAKWNADKSELLDHALYTIFIQSKTCVDGPELDSEEIRQNKDRVCDELLKIPFGKTGLYCLAYKKEKLPDTYNGNAAVGPREDTPHAVNEEKEIGRASYVSFPTDEMGILPNMMKKIEDARDPHKKMDAHGVGLIHGEDDNANDIDDSAFIDDVHYYYDDYLYDAEDEDGGWDE